VVGASDVSGAIRAEAGLDPHVLQDFVREGGRLTDFEAEGVERITPDELLALDCDVLIPAALGGVIHEGNADDVRARLIVEGANAPTTPAADEILEGNGIEVIPDVMANAGGVVVSYFEWVQNLQHFRWDEREVNDRLGTIMRRAYRECSARSREEGASLRIAAYEMGIERVLEAARTRGYID
jgi:glutamate dehydrogenase (NAD(P)+)